MPISIYTSRIAAVITVVASLIAPGALAQEEDALPEQLVEGEHHTEAMPSEIPEADEMVLNLSAGGALNTGNTQAFQVSTGGDFRIVRGMHAVGANATFIYGRAKLDDTETDGFEDTTRNLNARLRYDFFLTQMDALFLAAVYRWDTFAGLDARLQGQGGYLRNLYMRGEAMRIWGEAGYDITYDNYTQEVLDVLVADGMDPDEETIVHSARLFMGYDNHLTETFSLLMGVEGLVNVEEPADFRINWDNALRSKINHSLQLELKFMLKYDNRQIPGTQKTDTSTQVNLVYAFI